MSDLSKRLRADRYNSTLDLQKAAYQPGNNSSAEARARETQNVDMNAEDGVMRIFWPLETLKPNISGTLVGWQNSNSDIFVVAILENAQVFYNSPYS